MSQPDTRNDPRWIVHNIVAHPVSEVCYWVGRFGEWIHDVTVPEHEEGTGRG